MTQEQVCENVYRLLKLGEGTGFTFARALVQVVLDEARSCRDAEIIFNTVLVLYEVLLAASYTQHAENVLTCREDIEALKWGDDAE